VSHIPAQRRRHTDYASSAHIPSLQVSSDSDPTTFEIIAKITTVRARPAG
jgi:hypothetical protein